MTAPWLFTCRHTFESTLLAEMRHLQLPLMRAVELAPGLLRVDLPPETPILAANPAYALQILPNATEVFAPSIRALALPIAEALRVALDGQPGTWDLHALVPGQAQQSQCGREHVGVLHEASHSLPAPSPCG